MVMWITSADSCLGQSRPHRLRVVIRCSEKFRREPLNVSSERVRSIIRYIPVCPIAGVSYSYQKRVGLLAKPMQYLTTGFGLKNPHFYFQFSLLAVSIGARQAFVVPFIRFLCWGVHNSQHWKKRASMFPKSGHLSYFSLIIDLVL